jgi:hypothetical protein
MRPPVRRGHVRSASAGGNFSLTQALRGQQVQRNNSAVNSKDTKGMHLIQKSDFLDFFSFNGWKIWEEGVFFY